MKKKILTILLITVMSLSLMACSEKSEKKSTDTETAENEDRSDLDALGDVEVDEKLFSVELTIPADYVGDTTQEELDKSAEENGFKSITLNDDGSATYIMTKKQHEEMMSGIADEINSNLTGMIGSEDYPNITNIETNENYTSFTVTTSSTELDLNESFSVMAFYTYGGMYNIFNGTSVDNVHVDFVNADTGDVISSANSSDAE